MRDVPDFHGIKLMKSKDDYLDYIVASKPLQLFKRQMLKRCLEDDATELGNFFQRVVSKNLLQRRPPQITLPGFSVAAGRSVDFLLDFSLRLADGSINLRETVNCPETYFNTRMRAVIQALLVFEKECSVSAYIMEQKTPLYRFFKNVFPALKGSEFLGESVPLGQTDQEGLRNEDATQLTFRDEIFDLAMSFDVLEHIPSYLSAFREVWRILRPGGRFYFTAPFETSSQEHLVRAKIYDGSIVHLLEPEWHGDPVTGEGILCFHHFGWDVLDQLRACGFSSINVLALDAIEYGYYTEEPMLVFKVVK